MIVTIDGPAGSGKSTAARRLAERLGFSFLDTGAMYRAVGLKCLREGIDLEDHGAVARAAESATIELDDTRVFLDGQEVTEAVRTSEASEAASRVAVVGGVRSAMVGLQRRCAAGRDFVTEGRDQGTVAFPAAEHKFFLTADATERARRRQQELAGQGTTASFEEIYAQILDRDARDSGRAVAPLRPAADALLIDTSTREIETVVDELERHVRGKTND
jgi:CMP/dCMP kinase